MNNQNLQDEQPQKSNVPLNIDQIALEANEIWALVANNYRRLGAMNQEFAKHQLNLNQRLSHLTSENKRLTEELEKLKKK